MLVKSYGHLMDEGRWMPSGSFLALIVDTTRVGSCVILMLLFAELGPSCPIDVVWTSSAHGVGRSCLTTLMLILEVHRLFVMSRNYCPS